MWPTSSTIMCQNSLSPTSRFKPGKNSELLNISTFFFSSFFLLPHPPTTSSGPEMVVTAALINWVEVCWSATGDPGTVVKLGQCQALQPRLLVFSLKNRILSYINLISLFICMLRPFVFACPDGFPVPTADVTLWDVARKAKFFDFFHVCIFLSLDCKNIL